MDYDFERSDFVVSWYVVGDLAAVPDYDEDNTYYNQDDAEKGARDLATLDCSPIGIWRSDNYDPEPILIAIAFEGKVFVGE